MKFPVRLAAFYAILAISSPVVLTAQLTTTISVAPAAQTSSARATIDNLSPLSILAGSGSFDLTISGSGFKKGMQVSFGSNMLTPSIINKTSLATTVPANLITVGANIPVSVFDPVKGANSSSLIFTVNNPVPVITQIYPTSLTVSDLDQTLTITGTNFVATSKVMVGAAALTPTTVGGTSITVTIPASELATAGILILSVSNPQPGGGNSNSLEIQVNNPVPLLTSSLPTSITVSDQDKVVIVRGSGFIQGTTVKIGGNSLTPSTVEFGAVSVTVPSTLLSQPGKLVITAQNPAPGGGHSNQLQFIVHGLAATSWRTTANNFTTIPDSELTFNSFNQPSINQSGLVVFKGQSKGQSGPELGIYTREMYAAESQPLTKVADNATNVPAPNNTTYNSQPAAFIQFPSFPRIDKDSNTVAFRGQSQPVWTYVLGDGTETRVGSTGIFSNPSSQLVTGVNILGAVPGFEYFSVPGAPSGTRFDQFPGSPAVADGSRVVFKGNYTVDNISKTGVFFRDLTTQGRLVELIANSDTRIPNQPEGGTVVFGSTAPPSAADGMMVFVGLDNEEEPSLGGIYATQLVSSPTLDPLVSLGDWVPGEADGVTFNRIGEGLSFDGRFVAFWGAWGTETRLRHLACPTDGNADVIQACNEQHPNGYQAQLPVHQGVFVFDMQDRTITPIAKSPGEFEDFVYWVFSGRPPGTGDSDGGDIPEPPRWRSSAFIATQSNGNTFTVAFKAQTGLTDAIYLGHSLAEKPTETVIETTMPGSQIDPAGAAEGSSIVTVGLERDGLRGNKLVVSSSTLYEDAETSIGGAGIYTTEVAP